MNGRRGSVLKVGSGKGHIRDVVQLKGDKMPTHRTGSDGKRIKIPDGYDSRQGSDGHVVRIPPGATSRQGSDGRVVAIPPGKTTRQNKRGRIVIVG